MSKRKQNHRKAKVIITLAFLILAGMLWQKCMVEREKAKYAPIGEYLDVGSYQMHYYCKGEGNTVFVFITGSGTPCAYTDFYKLQEDLSAYGKTISFDHAGFGWSSKTEEKRDIKNLTKELHTLIEKTVPNQNNVILISHSLGALEAIHYAQQYPDKVKGIVFLDGGSPGFYSTDSQISSAIMNRACSVVREIGIARLMAVCGVRFPIYGEVARSNKLPKEVRGLDLAMYERYMGNYENLDVILHMNENAKEVSKGERLNTMPILVLSSDHGEEWQSVQRELASWSKSGRQVTIKGADHYLHWSNEKEVEEEIIKFVD